MNDLFMKVFMPVKYWENEAHKAYDILLGAEYDYKKAAKNHRKRSHLNFEYKLARLNYEKAWAKYTKVRGY